MQFHKFYTFDLLSVVIFLSPLMMACNKNEIHEGAAM